MHRIGVFCGANPGRLPSYLRAASELGSLLGSQRIELVYGGSSKGLMGAVADAALAAGGAVTGVIPASLADREIAHEGLTTLDIVDSMHARKQRMAELADAFVTLPGGFGTLDETFEILTWTQIGVHRKPLGLLNIDGFFDTLLAFADEQVAQGFVQAKHRDMLAVADQPEALIATLQSLSLPETRAWRD